jgi:hypothetical protein
MCKVEALFVPSIEINDLREWALLCVKNSGKFLDFDPSFVVSGGKHSKEETSAMAAAARKSG